MPKNPDETFDIIEKIERASLDDRDAIRFEFLHKIYSILTMHETKDQDLYFRFMLRNFLYLWQIDHNEALLYLYCLGKDLKISNTQVLSTFALYFLVFSSMENSIRFLIEIKTSNHFFIKKLSEMVKINDYRGLKSLMGDYWYIPALKEDNEKIYFLKSLEQEESPIVSSSVTPSKESPVSEGFHFDKSFAVTPDKTPVNCKRFSSLNVNDSASNCDARTPIHKSIKSLKSYGKDFICSPIVRKRYAPSPVTLVKELNESATILCDSTIRVLDDSLINELNEVVLCYDSGSETNDFLNASNFSTSDLCYGGYHSLKLFAEGGCSKVYGAIGDNDNKEYAIKVMYFSNESLRKTIEDEIKIMTLMSSSNRSIGLIEGRIGTRGAVIVMEKAVTDLKNFFISCRRNVNHYFISYYWFEMIKCVKAMHDNRIAHLDLKLQNFVLTENWQVKIIDYGISRELPSDSSVIYDNDGSGTVIFMSPELLRDEKIIVPKKCDIWAMGIVLYYLIYDSQPQFQMRAGTRAAITPDEYTNFLTVHRFPIYMPDHVNATLLLMKLMKMCLVESIIERTTVEEIISMMESYQ